jgi:hypothetical protein
MSKKTMLLTLAVAALFALPSAASAQEIHLSGVTELSGSGGAVTLTATNEPKISCTASTHIWRMNAGSTTTGTYHTHLSGCTAELLGIKGNCNSAGAASGTVTDAGTFHLITHWYSSFFGPSYLYTWQVTTITCIGFSRIEMTGNTIGKITSPACGANSKTISVSFESEGSTQKQLEYTGNKYDLSTNTEKENGETTSTSTAAIQGSATLSSATEGKLECT